MIDLNPGHAALETMRDRLAEPHVRELLRTRSRIVEPVFAQIKHNGGFRRWTVFGLENVRTQWALLCSSWNLRRIYAVWREGPTRSAPQRAITAIATAAGSLRCALHSLVTQLAPDPDTESDSMTWTGGPPAATYAAV